MASQTCAWGGSLPLLGQGSVKILLTLVSEADVLASLLRDEESRMTASKLRLSDAEAALLEYVEKYGLTDRARAYFQSLDAGPRNLPSVQESPPASDCRLGNRKATS